MKVLITRPWPSMAIDKIKQRFPDVDIRNNDRPMSAGEMTTALTHYDIIAPTIGDRFSAKVFQAAADIQLTCRLLANYGAGFDHIDVSAANQAGIQVTNTPGATTIATAETTMILLLMAARRITEGQAMLFGQPGWPGWAPTQLVGTGLHGKTLGIVGMGEIGKEVARKAYLGFGMDILYYNRTPKAGMQGIIATQVPDVDTLCRKSDFVSVHMASAPATRGIIGKKQLDLIGPNGILVNTARGDLIDEMATIQALRDGRLGGAGIDVFQNEPALKPDWFDAPNATLLPHMGSGTIETRSAMALKALGNMKAFADGRALIDPVTS